MVYHLTLEEQAEALVAQMHRDNVAKDNLIIDIALKMFSDDPAAPSPEQLDMAKTMYEVVSMILEFKKNHRYG